ncbi:Peptidyl-prolyl cis-trans isomerase CYP40, partial [Bienertia sinuspersici]
ELKGYNVNVISGDDVKQANLGSQHHFKSVHVGLEFVPIEKGVRFHRILKGAVIQGGDISGGGESGGESVYSEKFDDENFELRHERKGMFLMVNTGPILMGLNSLLLLLKPINSMLMLINRPLLDIVIENCGEIPEGGDYGVINFFKDGDTYPDWPSDLDS